MLNISKADLKLAANAAAQAASLSPKRRRTVSRSRTKSGGEMSMSDLSDTDSKTSDRQRRTSGGSRRRHNSTGPGGRRQRLMSSGSDVIPMDTTSVTDNGTTSVGTLLTVQPGNSVTMTSTNMSPPMSPPISDMVTVKKEPVNELEVKKCA